MTARAPSPPTGPWIWADDLVAWIAAQTLGMALAAARDELNAAWRGGRIEAFHGRSDRKEPKPVPPEASAHPTAEIRPGNRIVGAAALVAARRQRAAPMPCEGEPMAVADREATEALAREGELIQHVLAAEVCLAGVRFPSVDALALWPKAAARGTRRGADKPTDRAVYDCLLAYFQAARERGEPPPKMESDAFPHCKAATGARHAQMEAAVARPDFPAELKRRRGKPGK